MHFLVKDYIHDLEKLLYQAIDLLVEVESETKQYDYNSRKKRVIERSQLILKTSPLERGYDD